MNKVYSTKPGVYYVKDKPLVIDKSLVRFLALECQRLSINSARICVHDSHQSNLMVMLVVVINRYSYPTHKHDWKDESYTIVEGSARFECMNSKGEVETSVELVEGQTILNNMKEYHRLEPNSKILAFIETTTGPFTNRPLEFLRK